MWLFYFLQHLREPGSNIEYFVIGAAHVVDTSQKHNDSVPKDSLLFHYAEKDKLGGFAYVQGSPDGLHFVFANGFDSKDIYHTVIKPRSFFWKHRQVVYDKTSGPSTDIEGRSSQTYTSYCQPSNSELVHSGPLPTTHMKTNAI